VNWLVSWRKKWNLAWDHFLKSIVVVVVRLKLVHKRLKLDLVKGLRMIHMAKVNISNQLDLVHLNYIYTWRMLEVVDWIWMFWIGGSWTHADSQLLQALPEMCLLYISLLWPLSLPLVPKEEFLIRIVVLLHIKWWKHFFVHNIG